jgi:CRP/FNR family transcriptional regulator, cyclic AMP receptor protein
MSEKVWIIKRCGLLRQLSVPQLKFLESHSESRAFDGGTTIDLPADRPDGAMVLTSGRAKICRRDSAGIVSVLTLVEPGELFGELPVSDHVSWDEYAGAVEKSHVVFIPRPTIEELPLEAPEHAHGVAKWIGFRRRRLERQLKHLMFRSTHERLIHLLLDLVNQFGKATHDGIALGVKLSQQELAHLVGSTREKIAAVLERLQAKGCLKHRQGTITLTTLDGLKKQLLKSSS